MSIDSGLVSQWLGVRLETPPLSALDNLFQICILFSSISGVKGGGVLHVHTHTNHAHIDTHTFHNPIMILTGKTHLSIVS